MSRIALLRTRHPATHSYEGLDLFPPPRNSTPSRKQRAACTRDDAVDPAVDDDYALGAAIAAADANADAPAVGATRNSLASLLIQ